MKLGRRQLLQRAALDGTDEAELLSCRGDHNRLGFAYQVAFVKVHGRLPKQQPLEIDDELVVLAAQQASADVGAMEEYRQQRQTIQRHQERLRAYRGLSRLGDEELEALEAFVFKAAMRIEHRTSLLTQAHEFLRERRVLLPAESTLERVVAEQRQLARAQIFERVTAGIEPAVRQTLDDLLVVGEGAESPLQTIKANPSKPSADGILALVDKLAAIEKTQVLTVELSWLSGNYQRALYHQARKASADRLRDLSQPRRHATLVCFLWQSYRDAIDQLVDMFDKILTRTQRQAQEDIDERMRRHRELIRQSLTSLQAMGSVLLDESVPDAEVRAAVFERVSQQDLRGYVEEVEEWVAGRSSDPFHGVVRRYGQLRKFTPALVSALQLRQDTETKGACLRALEVLEELNATGRRKLPQGVPMDFVPKRLEPIVVSGSRPDRRAWECALLLRVRDELRSGNVSVDHSKRFGPLDSFFMRSSRWQGARQSFFARAGLPSDPRQVPDYLGHRLGQAFDRFLESARRQSLRAGRAGRLEVVGRRPWAPRRPE